MTFTFLRRDKHKNQPNMAKMMKKMSAKKMAAKAKKMASKKK